MGNNGYYGKLIIDLPRTEENKELFASRIDMEKEEMLRKNDKNYKEKNTRRNDT